MQWPRCYGASIRPSRLTRWIFRLMIRKDSQSPADAALLYRVLVMVLRGKRMALRRNIFSSTSETAIDTRVRSNFAGVVRTIKGFAGIQFDVARVLIRRHGSWSFLTEKNRLDRRDSKSLSWVATIAVRSRFSTNADHDGAGARQPRCTVTNDRDSTTSTRTIRATRIPGCAEESSARSDGMQVIRIADSLKAIVVRA